VDYAFGQLRGPIGSGSSIRQRVTLPTSPDLLSNTYAASPLASTIIALTGNLNFWGFPLRMMDLNFFSFFENSNLPVRKAPFTPIQTQFMGNWKLYSMRIVSNIPRRLSSVNISPSQAPWDWG
jgi:hypothetical protein